jgi:hypothetical protein
MTFGVSRFNNSALQTGTISAQPPVGSPTGG